MLTAQKTFSNCPDQSTVEIELITDTTGGGSVVAVCRPRVNGLAAPPNVDLIAGSLSRVVASPDRYRFNVFINFPVAKASAILAVELKDPTGSTIDTFAKKVTSDQDTNFRISIAVLTQLPGGSGGNSPGNGDENEE